MRKWVVSYEEKKICSKENQKVNKETQVSKPGACYPKALWITTDERK